MRHLVNGLFLHFGGCHARVIVSLAANVERMAARKRVLESFSIERNVASLERIYTAVTKRSRCV